jgi:hypothetical protein
MLNSPPRRNVPTSPGGDPIFWGEGGLFPRSPEIPGAALSDRDQYSRFIGTSSFQTCVAGLLDTGRSPQRAKSASRMSLRYKDYALMFGPENLWYLRRNNPMPDCCPTCPSRVNAHPGEESVQRWPALTGAARPCTRPPDSRQSGKDWLALSNPSRAPAP